MAGTGTETSTERCLKQVRQMILDGDLLPGEKVLQADLATKLNVSRIPLREALAALHAEGVLDHKPNTGFCVARFNAADLDEIYLMRRLLETELLRTADLNRADVGELARLNDAVGKLGPDRDTDELERLASAFHHHLFDLSPLRLVRAEVAALWYKSSFYRQFFLSSTGSPERVHADHERILDAVRRQDVEEVVRLSDEHRVGTPENVSGRLPLRR